MRRAAMRMALRPAFGLQPGERPEGRVAEQGCDDHDDYKDGFREDEAVPRPFAEVNLPVVEGHLPDEHEKDADRVDKHEADQRGQEHDGAHAVAGA